MSAARDHVASGRNRPNAKNVIDSKSLEHRFSEKPVPTFSRDALATLSALRRSLAGLEWGFEPGATNAFSFGLPEVDEPLGGGLARGGLHEIYAMGSADAASAMGFAAALAVRSADGRPVVWVQQEVFDGEIGWLHAPGLAELGLDPGHVILVRARDAAGVLRAGAEAVRCPALGAVVIETWGEPKALDLTATRRLSLAAARSGVTLLSVRVAAQPMPSAAVTRWAVRAAASAPLEANVPGLPAFAVSLLRHRAGVPRRDWQVEWDRDRHCFKNASPLSRLVVSVPASRPAVPARSSEKRRRAG